MKGIMDADTNICAVILNYNDAQTTMKLTESWKNSKVIRNIIIVDNCSTDDSWEKLGEFKEEFASKYGIRSIGIFGSVARGENHPDSDVDVFVDLEEADPFIMFDIRETLQSLFGCKVDLVRLREGLRTLLLKRIEQDGIYA